MFIIYILLIFIAIISYFLLRDFSASIRFGVPVLIIMVSSLILFILVKMAVQQDAKHAGKEMTYKDIKLLHKESGKENKAIKEGDAKDKNK